MAHLHEETITVSFKITRLVKGDHALCDGDADMETMASLDALVKEMLMAQTPVEQLEEVIKEFLNDPSLIVELVQN